MHVAVINSGGEMVLRVVAARESAEAPT
jgi:hypothetical protein